MQIQYGLQISMASESMFKLKFPAYSRLLQATSPVSNQDTNATSTLDLLKALQKINVYFKLFKLIIH